MTELQAKAIKRINEAYDMACKFYNMSFILPTISFKLKGRRAGYAQCFVNKIALNNDMLHAYGDVFINDTPGHEAAHLIARHVYGHNIMPHGCEWKKVMRVIGQEPSRCHNFEVKTRNEYICKCDKTIYISTTKHNRILRGNARFYCTTCKTEIRWKKLYEKVTVNSPTVQVSPQISATIYR
jgi:SprT protein